MYIKIKHRDIFTNTDRNGWRLRLDFTFYDFKLVKKSSYYNAVFFKELLIKLFDLHTFFVYDSLSKSFKKINHDSVLEFIWTLLPSLILLFLAIPSLFYLYKIDFFFLEEGSMLTLKVIGNQWYWSYEFYNLFNDEITFFDSYMLSDSDFSFYKSNMLRLLETDNPMILPFCLPIRILITSSDVLHSWAVPSFGIKMDACPGRLNQIFIFIDRRGEFYGQCSEICGLNHGFMPIDIVVY